VYRYLHSRDGQLNPLAQAIVAAVTAGVCGQAELRKQVMRTTGAGDSTIRLLLRMLVKSGILEKAQRGWYQLRPEAVDSEPQAEEQ
jgi:DNA-binding IclR family transcriptional regulator